METLPKVGLRTELAILAHHIGNFKLKAFGYSCMAHGKSQHANLALMASFEPQDRILGGGVLGDLGVLGGYWWTWGGTQYKEPRRRKRKNTHIYDDVIF